MSKISFVYFDVGGVVIKDYSSTNKWEIMKNDLGATGNLSKQFETIFRQYNDRLVTGLIDADSLLKIIAKQLNLNIKEKTSLLNYFVDHFEQNMTIWSVISRVKATLKIGLLTDMYPGMLAAISAKKLLPPATAWDIIVDSSILGVKKPMPKIYEIAQEKANIPDKEILFIDNSQKNLTVPQSLGWQTFFYDSSNYEKSSAELANFLSLSFREIKPLSVLQFTHAQFSRENFRWERQTTR